MQRLNTPDDFEKRIRSLERKMDKLDLLIANLATKDDLKNLATKDDLKIGLASTEASLKNEIRDVEFNLKKEITLTRKRYVGQANPPTIVE